MGRQGTALASSMGRPTTGEAAHDEDDYIATRIGQACSEPFFTYFSHKSKAHFLVQFFVYLP